MNKIKYYFENYFLTISIILLFAVIGLIAKFNGFHYETNDDIFLEWSYSGYFTGETEVGSLFNHFIFGSLMKGLYGISNAVNWFGYVLLALLIISILWILNLVKNINNAPLKLFILIFLVLVVFFKLSTKINWTNISFVCACSGILYLLCSQTLNITENIISNTLIVFSILIRIEMFLMLMVISSIYWIYLIVFKRDFAVAKRLLFLLGIAITLHLANLIYYKNNEKWAESKSTYSLIMKLADNPSFTEENVSSVFSNSTWTENDFRLFKHFFYDLPNACEQNKLKTIIKATPNNIFNLSQIKQGLDKVINYKHVLLVLACLLIYAFFYINKKIAVLHILNLLIVGIVFYSMTGTKEIFKERIFFPMYFFFILFILLFQNNYSIRLKSKLRVLGVNAILFFSFLIVLKDSIRLQSNDNCNDREIFDFLGKQDQYILDFNCVLPLERFDLRYSSESQLKNTKYLPTGWINACPIATDYYKRNNLQSMHQAIFSPKTRVLLLKSQYTEFIDLMGTFYNQYLPNSKFKFSITNSFKNIILVQVTNY
jgi:hypothetical protein